MSKPIGEFNELDCLRALVARQWGVDPNNGYIGGGGGSGIVTGIPETRTVTQNASTTSPYTIPAGWLSYTMEMSSDFTGTVNGIARTGAATPSISDYAAPGNTGPAIAVVRTAGNYTITEGRV